MADFPFCQLTFISPFANKHPKHVASALRPRSIEGFLDALPYTFQWNQSDGLEATYHFTFTGKEQRQATVVIANKALEVHAGHVGTADLRLTADSQTWIGFLAGERSLLWALITRRIRLKGSPRLLVKFGNCFPSPGPKHRPVEDWREKALARSVRLVFHRNDPATGRIAARNAPPDEANPSHQSATKATSQSIPERGDSS